MTAFNYRSMIWSFGLEDDDAVFDIEYGDARDVRDGICETACKSCEFLYQHEAETAVATRMDVVRKLLATGYSANNAEWLGANPDGTMEQYMYYLGCETERYRIENALFAKVPQVVQAIALCHLARLYGDDLDDGAWAAVPPAIDGYGVYADIDDIRDAASDAYVKALIGAAA